MNAGFECIELKEFKGTKQTVLSCGADMKNRFCVFNGGNIYLSADSGDLSDPQNFLSFKNSIFDMIDRLNVKPEIIAYDLHPQYYSSTIKNMFLEAEHIGVQHHHAHTASMLALSADNGPVLGISFDGTGYGTDGNMWGGEFLIVSDQGFERAGHFDYIKMPGGETAVKQPWRLAFSLCYENLGCRIFDSGMEFMELRPVREYIVLQSMIDKKINTFLTSSCGRLFDAVSSMLNITHETGFEAEAAINLEKCALAMDDPHSYRFDIAQKDGVFVIQYASFLKSIVGEIERGIPVGIIARRFHNSVANVILAVSKKIRSKKKINKVVLSGGVFLNGILRQTVLNLLKEADFDILQNENFQTTDLGICTGQTYAALNSLTLAGK